MDGGAPTTRSINIHTVTHVSNQQVSRLSPFETSSVFDEHLLTPVSSAASPELQQRSCKQSPFLHHRELTPCHQQPTPPHSTVMYSYPDYTTTTSSMPMQTAAVADAAAPHELLSYHLHGSPGHHGEQQQAPPPPPQSQPYFGSYSVSVPQEPVPEHYYLQGGTIDNPLGLLRADVSSSGGGSSFTHRALAPLAQASPSMAPTTMIHHHQQPAPPPQYSSRRELDMALPKLSSPPTHSRHTSLSLRRDPARKTKARRSNSSSNNNSSGNNRRDSSYSPPAQGQYQFGEEVMAAEGGGAGDNGPDEEVTLDDKTPADLRRLWDTRRKWLGKKGNGMWEDIMVEYLGEEGHSENKKTQVKAALQMKIHRMLLKHAEWPARDVSTSYPSSTFIFHPPTINAHSTLTSRDRMPPSFAPTSVTRKTGTTRFSACTRRRCPGNARLTSGSPSTSRRSSSSWASRRKSVTATPRLARESRSLRATRAVPPPPPPVLCAVFISSSTTTTTHPCRRQRPSGTTRECTIRPTGTTTTHKRPPLPCTTTRASRPPASPSG